MHLHSANPTGCFEHTYTELIMVGWGNRKRIHSMTHVPLQCSPSYRRLCLHPWFVRSFRILMLHQVTPNAINVKPWYVTVTNPELVTRALPVATSSAASCQCSNWYGGIEELIYWNIVITPIPSRTESWFDCLHEFVHGEKVPSDPLLLWSNPFSHCCYDNIHMGAGLVEKQLRIRHRNWVAALSIAEWIVARRFWIPSGMALRASAIIFI